MTRPMQQCAGLGFGESQPEMLRQALDVTPRHFDLGIAAAIRGTFVARVLRLRGNRNCLHGGRGFYADNMTISALTLSHCGSVKANGFLTKGKGR